jgi:hypothetical protein
MISGMSTFTLVHVVLSLVGIFAGFVVVFGLLMAKPLDGWTALFLVTTALTSVTGFFFPFHGLTPGLVIGVLSLIALAIAIFARYQRHLAGGWRRSYVISSMIALYFNVFILIVQLYEKVPALKALAPTQSEAPFKLTQLTTLVLFIVLGILAAIRFRNEELRAA